MQVVVPGGGGGRQIATIFRTALITTDTYCTMPDTVQYKLLIHCVCVHYEVGLHLQWDQDSSFIGLLLAYKRVFKLAIMDHFDPE